MKNKTIVKLGIENKKLLEALKYLRRFVKKGYIDTDYIDEIIKECENEKA